MLSSGSVDWLGWRTGLLQPTGASIRPWKGRRRAHVWEVLCVYVYAPWNSQLIPRPLYVYICVSVCVVDCIEWPERMNWTLIADDNERVCARGSPHSQKSRCPYERKKERKIEALIDWTNYHICEMQSRDSKQANQPNKHTNLLLSLSFFLSFWFFVIVFTYSNKPTQRNTTSLTPNFDNMNSASCTCKSKTRASPAQPSPNGDMNEWIRRRLRN